MPSRTQAYNDIVLLQRHIEKNCGGVRTGETVAQAAIRLMRAEPVMEPAKVLDIREAVDDQFDEPEPIEE
jgi:hypothetical protein